MSAMHSHPERRAAARNAKTDHLLAMVLAAGGVLSFALLLLGALMQIAGSRLATQVLRAGVLVLMSTPVMRVAVSVFTFYRERDHKYMLIAFAVLVIVVVGALLRVAI